MGSLLVVDGSGVCRAPMLEFVLRDSLVRGAGASVIDVEARGLAAQADRTMCESAAARIGYSGPAIAFFGAYRARPLSTADIARADLVLTAERPQRSAVVRMLPGTQAAVFTCKEALVLASVLAERRRATGHATRENLPALVRALHATRGTVPLIEPPTRTGPFHWVRGTEAAQQTIPAGHGAQADHRRVTQETFDVAVGLAARLNELLHGPAEGLLPGGRQQPTRWFRRSA